MYVLKKDYATLFLLVYSTLNPPKKKKTELVLGFNLSFRTLCLVCYIFKRKREDTFKFSSDFLAVN